MKIGAHVSSAKSVDLSFDRAAEIQAECFQIFVTPPQQWLKKIYTDEEISKFQAKANSTQLGPNFIHGTYLVNLGATGAEHLRKSIDWLHYSLGVADQLGLTGTIFHLGSHKGAGFVAIKSQVIEALKKILDQAPEKPFLILETSAGAGGNIGGTFTELGELIKGVGDSRLKICLDTQHIFAAGYNIKDRQGVDKMFQEFDQTIGLDKLVVCHANDSKTEFGSGKDRHENIGQGLIGVDGFKLLMHHPAMENVPMILEVPGTDNSGPDLKNVELLKSLR